MTKILVLGGAGYVGSQFCRAASEAGFDVRVFDDFSTGHEWAVVNYEVVRGDILDAEKLSCAMQDVDAVCHFAAKSCVEESVKDPMTYMRTNVDGTRSVLSAMSKAGIQNLVFSSTAAVYGDPDESVSQLTEAMECSPVNPYGQSKLASEALIEGWCAEQSSSATCFRYFNAAGASPEWGLGEAHEPETHLIPNILRCLINKSGKPFELFGDDYPTPDGTCVRDYVHVNDIADAHLRGLMYQSTGNSGFVACNLGSGSGYSIYQVIRACEDVSGLRLDKVVKRRRLGDPVRLVASNSKASKSFGWKPTNSDLRNIVSTAYQWHLSYESSKKS